MALLGLGDAAYAEAIVQHHGHLRSDRVSDGGIDLAARSDSLLATFTSPRDCVEAAIGIQRRLSEHDSPNG
jgi:hypothetical protein